MKKKILDIINEEVVTENQDNLLNEILDNLEGLDDSSPTLPQYGDRLNSISEEANKTIMPKVKETDANKLIDWWNANTKYYHFKVKRNDGYWDVVRQLT